MAFVGTPLCVRVRGAPPPTARTMTRRPVPAGHPTRASSRMSISENTSAAGATPTVGPPAAVVTSASVSDEDVGNRSFQLIEMEDSEQAVSALYLRADDHGVDFGATDGPVPDSVTGEWVLHDDDGTLGLSLTRKYEGDFSFEVTRFYKGHYQRREGSSLVTVEGYIFMPEVLMNPENAVGFFSLVMATDDLPSEDYDVTKPGGK